MSQYRLKVTSQLKMFEKINNIFRVNPHIRQTTFRHLLLNINTESWRVVTWKFSNFFLNFVDVAWRILLCSISIIPQLRYDPCCLKMLCYKPNYTFCRYRNRVTDLCLFFVRSVQGNNFINMKCMPFIHWAETISEHLSALGYAACKQTIFSFDNYRVRSAIWL